MGRILEFSGGVYRIQLGPGREVEASLRGRLKHASAIPAAVVGDLVGISRDDQTEDWTIEEVVERRNQLMRAAPGGRGPKLVVTNVDRVLVVVSAAEPTFDPHTADRFLVLAETCGIRPVLVLNKMDLSGAAKVAKDVIGTYEAIGYEVLTASARTGEGLEALRDLLEEGVSTLIGPSGVGKSSIMNALFPRLKLRTREVSARGGRGRHTTVGSRLISVSDEGWVADTPGFSDVSLWGVVSTDLSAAFPEFRGPAERCRFRGCTHTHEPECGVLVALEAGQVKRERYESYRSLLAQA